MASQQHYDSDSSSAKYTSIYKDDKYQTDLLTSRFTYWHFDLAANHITMCPSDSIPPDIINFLGTNVRYDSGIAETLSPTAWGIAKNTSCLHILFLESLSLNISKSASRLRSFSVGTKTL